MRYLFIVIVFFSSAFVHAMDVPDNSATSSVWECRAQCAMYSYDSRTGSDWTVGSTIQASDSTPLRALGAIIDKCLARIDYKSGWSYGNIVINLRKQFRPYPYSNKYDISMTIATPQNACVQVNTNNH